MSIARDGTVRKLLHGLRWNSGGLVAQALLQFAFGIALARILGPGVFGTMAGAWAVVMPALVIADAGLGLAIVQRDALSSDEIKFCFLAQLFLGVLAAAALCAVSGTAAQFFKEPELQPVLAVLSSVVVLQALGLTAVNLMRRSVEFRRIQVVQISAYLGSQLLLALPLAIAGAGVWSLVAGAVANAAFGSIGAYAVVRHDVGWRFDRRALLLPSMSARFLLLNLINSALGALPPIVMGRLAGVSSVGLFDRTYSLFVTPVDRASAAVSGVLFPFFARTNQHSSVQHDVFLASLTAALFVGIPGVILTYLQGALVIEATLGAKWTAATPLVAPLAIFIVLLPALQVSVPVLNGRGRPDIEIGVVAGTITLFLLGVAFWSHGELVRILWCLAAAYGFRVFFVVLAAMLFVSASLGQLLSVFIPGALAGGLTLAFQLGLELAFPAATPALLHLAAAGLLGGGVLLASWRLAQILLPNGHIRRAFGGA